MKTVEQQTLQALHRVRTQWQAARTARINVMRGLLREQGLPVPVGARTVLARVAAILEDADIALPDLPDDVLLRAVLSAWQPSSAPRGERPRLAPPRPSKSLTPMPNGASC